MTPSRELRRPIRVLMVMPSYYPVVGGMEIQVERLLPHLREHGVEASVLTRQSAGTSGVEQRDGVEIRRVSVPGGPGLRSITFTGRGIVDIIRNRRTIDVIHAHSLMSPSTIAAVAGALIRTPRIVTPHQSYEPEHLLSKPLGKQRFRLYRSNISAFVSISSDIERLLLQNDIPSSRIVSIPNGIDTAHFSPACAAARTALREQLGLPPELPVVVFAGRLQPVKQVDVLLRAWSNVTGGHLVILGDGEERAALTALAKGLDLADRVEFRGMVANVVDFLRASDIFVLPSASEGLSVALLEAMSSGLVPIATSIGGTVDLIQNQTNGLLVRPGDVAGLEAALAQALDAPDWRREAARNGRKHVVAHYDLRIVSAQLAGVYRDMLAER